MVEYVLLDECAGGRPSYFRGLTSSAVQVTMDLSRAKKFKSLRLIRVFKKALDYKYVRIVKVN